MFKKIDDSTIINTDQVVFFHEKTRILKLTSGQTFQVDPDRIEELKRCFSMINTKQTP